MVQINLKVKKYLNHRWINLIQKYDNNVTFITKWWSQLSKLSLLSQDDFKIPKRKKTRIIPEPLVTAPEVTQDQDDMEKYDKVSSSIEGSKKTSVCVTPLLSLNTPPKYINKRDYKGDTHDKTLDSRTKDTDV